ncbi:deoxyguanosinetriphosphate triphosphohydrolase [Ectothiorhodospiraceae bacterium 2226]|nr:deoxyguanosinetriphosphate triphosphohydrolase [Ectothiorhodospiraceae bacterium 2226]
MAMRWETLLSRRRLGKREVDAAVSARTDFQRDFDRIVFSSAFRRLQDKTQVFPLAGNDYVRTRLTHSLESSSVGRSLGTLVGERIIARHRLGRDVDPSDFGAIVAAACLSHDIGNPPFGHLGEDAICEWFASSPLGQRVLEQLTPAERLDLARFEGNAQGFRILARLQSRDNPGGLQLTAATLGAFTKYPRGSTAAGQGQGASAKKHGYFADDAALFAEVAETLALLPRGEGAWCRHPLAFLVEAADDICYRVIDLEDSYRVGLLEYREVHDLLRAVVAEPDLDRRLAGIRGPKERIEYLRARAINSIILQVTESFMEHEAAMLEGRFDASLLDHIPAAPAVQGLLEIAMARIYVAPQVMEVEAAGFEVLGGLLEAFVAAAEEVAAHGARAASRSRVFLRLIPEQFIGSATAPEPAAYRRLLGITDFVSGMTDSYAVTLYKRIKGISLPQR